MNWSFDKIEGNWIGGRPSQQTGKKIKIEKNPITKKMRKNARKYCIKVFNIEGKDPKLLEEKIIFPKDYKSKDEFEKDTYKLDYETYKKYGYLVNKYRNVIYKGQKAAEMQLTKGVSVLIEQYHIDKVEKFGATWNALDTGKGKYHASCTYNRKKLYLSNFLYDNIYDIVEFKDGNSLNLLKSNIKDSGKKKTIITDDIMKKNKQIKEQYDIMIKKERATRLKIYDENGYFIFDRILSPWYGKNNKIKVVNRNNEIQVLYINYKRNIIPLKSSIYDDNNKKQVIYESKKYRNNLIRKCENDQTKKPYRYVIYNGIRCVEMEATKGKTTIFDIKYLNTFKMINWSANKNHNIWRIQANTGQYMHRIITNNKWSMVDHIDGNELNNLEANLRDGANINNYNCKMRENNQTGYNGISWDPIQNRYRFRWQNKNKEDKMKAFPVKLWRTEENALNAAIAFKTKKDKKFNNTNGIRT